MGGRVRVWVKTRVHAGVTWGWLGRGRRWGSGGELGSPVVICASVSEPRVGEPPGEGLWLAG